MDTSVEYIMMCQRANELQQQWNPSVGDYFTTSSSYCDKGECSKNCMCKECARMANGFVISGQFDYVPEIGGTHWFFGGHARVKGKGNFANDTACYTMTRDGTSGIYDRLTNSSIKEMVWLPRQDQIQKMFWSGLTDTTKVERFVEYLDTAAEYNPFYDSLESLWLSLIMKEKYNKKWNRISNVKQWEEIK